ncbi:hypothetical protein MNBD_GAMMA11-2800 [hydrothermal vent metagenome]|uniref:Uncharacterized protein n=1 Tax=hydrothermal vent metagenome TaxID=652676 RepID=A0A3B0WXY9_9ZZZZ
MQIQILLQTLVVPFFISVIAFRYLDERHALAGMVVAWLVSYFWILGKVPFVPQTAEELLWIFMGVAVLSRYFLQKNTFQYSLMGMFLAAIAAISWPVLSYEITVQFVLEMLLFVAAGSVVVVFKCRSDRPALLVVMGFTVLSLISALSGSLLIGQLAGSVSGVSAIYVLPEIRRYFRQKQMQDKTFSVLMLLYLLILYIARVFAEVELYVVIALMTAGLFGLFARKNTLLILTALMYIVSVAIMYSLGSDSSYY